jgi:hypothetical protein
MPRRYLRIDGDSGTLIWDLINGKFEISGNTFSEKKEFSRDLDRNETFRRQISNLLQPDSWNISGTSLLEAVHALELIEEIYGLTEFNSSKDVRIKR